jgi:hypothetical protein
MYATAAGADTGVPKSVAKEFVASDKPGKLPTHVGHHAYGGSPEDLINTATHVARQPFQMGGIGMSTASPWWERSESRAIDSPMYGFAMGSGGGRTDKNNVGVASGSYVLPADVVSGLGDGNSFHGAWVIDRMMRTLPYGAQAMAGARHGSGPPHAPGAFQDQEEKTTLARGGAPKDDIPIAAADGEVILHPDQVAAVGASYMPEDKAHDYKAALEHGHQLLDEFVKHVRGRTIKDLKNLPGPKNSDSPDEGHKA